MAQDREYRMSSGDPRMTFDDSGRPVFVYSEEAAAPRSLLLRWREDLPAPPVKRTVLQQHNDKALHPDPLPVTLPVTRRHDRPAYLPGSYDLRFGEPRLMMGEAQHVVYPGRTHMDAMVVDEMKVYNDPPFLYWLFIVEGVALIVVGILSLLWCLSWDVMYYSRFWTGILLILYGLSGAIHRGDYYKRLWKSWLFIALGVLTVVAVKLCTAFTLQTFCHQLIEVIQFNNWTNYLAEMTYRIQNLPDYPRNNLTGPPDWPNSNVVACFALDGVQVVIVMIAFLSFTSLLYVIDRFYNSHFIITRMVEPFCEPRLFNPFGQVSMGQVQMFLGFIIQSATHGAERYLWQDTYAPVWAGIIPCLAGVFTALSLKSCGLKHRLWNMLSIILQILTICGSIVAIVLVTIGMVQHYNTLGSTPVMTYYTFSQRLIVASIFLFCLSDITCLVNVFYALALLVRLIVCVCCTKADDQVPMITYVDHDLEDDPVFFAPAMRQIGQHRILEKTTMAHVKDLRR